MHRVHRTQAGPQEEGASRELDERLALAAAAGDDKAFAELYERYAQRLYAYCWTILHDEVNAQDVLQTTWLNALIALREQRRSAPVRPWLFRIAHNEAISLLRRLEPVNGAVALGGPAPSAEEQALRRERLHQVLADLRALPDRARGALVLRELCGLSHEEIAVALDTTVGAAKQSILEARRELNECVAGRETACAHIRSKITAGDRRALRARAVRAHLRHCPGCAALQDVAEQQRPGLLALIPPLAPLAAAHILHDVLMTPAHAAAAGAIGSSAAVTTGAGGPSAGSAGAAVAQSGAVAATGKAASSAVLGKVLASVAVGGIALVATAAHGRHHGGGLPVVHRPAAQVAGTTGVTRRLHARGAAGTPLAEESPPPPRGRGPGTRRRRPSRSSPHITTAPASPPSRHVRAHTAARPSRAVRPGRFRILATTRAPVLAPEHPSQALRTSPGGAKHDPGVRGSRIPPGQAKQHPHPVAPRIPPGQAKQHPHPAAPRIPPGQAKQHPHPAAPHIPPGQAKQHRGAGFPRTLPGQATKHTVRARPAPAAAAGPARRPTRPAHHSGK